MVVAVPGVYGKYLRCWEDNVDECEEQPAQPGTSGTAGVLLVCN